MPPLRFWRSAVAEPGPFGLEDIHRPKFTFESEDKVITAGSCFAQNISRSLHKAGLNWLVTESAPPSLSDDTARRFGYGIFTTRTGNIYTCAMLRQWMDRATGETEAVDEIWCESNGRYRDPLRPTVEPDGFGSKDELLAARRRTFQALNLAFRNGDVFIFTLGQTEAWKHRESGLVYQMCPGTQGGDFNPKFHQFENFGFQQTLADLEAVITKLKVINPKLKIILTVSPVPLTATAEDQHALVANSYTKATLRAVAGEAALRYKHVDYFPSYELLASPSMRGMFYKPNMRTVEPLGVDFVMDHFFQSYGLKCEKAQRNPERDEAECNEMILDFYNEH